jgi:GNAT superfamily N-acetyltransferase
MKVRDLDAADIPHLLPLLDELGYPVDAATLSARFERFTDQGEKALVAERDGRIIGLLTLHITPVLHRPGSVGRVTTLVVERKAHGQGVGRALMDEAERRLWDAGCVLIEVTSNRKRTDAHAFYEKLGYEKTSYRFGKPTPRS